MSSSNELSWTSSLEVPNLVLCLAQMQLFWQTGHCQIESWSTCSKYWSYFKNKQRWQNLVKFWEIGNPKNVQDKIQKLVWLLLISMKYSFNKDKCAYFKVHLLHTALNKLVFLRQWWQVDSSETTGTFIAAKIDSSKLELIF